MANQAIALQARAPKADMLGGAIQSNAKMINMMSQQRTADRQTAAAELDMKLAQERGDREAALAGPKMAEATSKAGLAQLEYATEFFDTSALALANVRDAQQAMMVGDRLKQLFPEPAFQQSVDQTLASIPQDPAQFQMWREESLLRTLDAKDQLAKEFTTQSTGAEQRIVATPKYGSGAASEVPGSRIQVAEGMTYVRDDQGNVYAMPKQTPGSFDSEAPSAGAGLVGGSRGGADTVYGKGKYGLPPKPLTKMSVGEVQDYQRTGLIPATRGRVGQGPRIGTGAVGTYQITYNTLKDYAPRVLGDNWRNTPFTADAQERIAKAIYDNVKGGNLKDTWAGLPANKPGAYANVPWEQVRGKIAQVESGGGRGTGDPVIRGPGATAAPKTTEDERKIASNVRNMISASKEMASVVREDPSAIAPSGGEYAAGQVPFYGEEAARFAQSGPRQRFNAALEKVLSAVTFINTGAGVSKEQMDGYRRSYFPTYQDTERTRQSKLLGVVQFIRDAKARAGNAWTPELDGALTELQKMFGSKATYKGKAAAPAAPRAAAPAATGSGKVLKYNPATGDFE